jgi:hypothetical protein
MNKRQMFHWNYLEKESGPGPGPMETNFLLDRYEYIFQLWATVGCRICILFDYCVRVKGDLLQIIYTIDSRIPSAGLKKKLVVAKIAVGPEDQVPTAAAPSGTPYPNFQGWATHFDKPNDRKQGHICVLVCY